MPDTDSVPFHPFDRQKKVDVSNRKLPHWQQPGGCYFITFRLADSLPQSRYAELLAKKHEWFRQHPAPLSEDERRDFGRLFTAKEEQWLDAGYGACHLARDNIRKPIITSLEKFDRIRYDLDCFVLMPNHVHLVWQMREGFLMTKELKSLKGATARFCNDTLGTSGNFWMEESYDRLIRDGNELNTFRKYIDGNPVKEGLANDMFTLKMNRRLVCH